MALWHVLARLWRRSNRVMTSLGGRVKQKYTLFFRRRTMMAATTIRTMTPRTVAIRTTMPPAALPLLEPCKSSPPVVIGGCGVASGSHADARTIPGVDEMSIKPLTDTSTKLRSNSLCKIDTVSLALSGAFKIPTSHHGQLQQPRHCMTCVYVRAFPTSMMLSRASKAEVVFSSKLT